MSIFLPIQILLLVFLLFAFTRVVLRYKDGTIPLGMFLFWIGIWALATLSIIRPDFTTYLARKAGIGRGADAVIYGALIVAFYLIFRITVIIENLRQDITRVVREVALKQVKKKK